MQLGKHYTAALITSTRHQYGQCSGLPRGAYLWHSRDPGAILSSQPTQFNPQRRANRGTSSNHHPSPVAHRRRSQAQPQPHYGTETPFSGLGHAQTSTWVIARESSTQAQKATGLCGATRAGTGAPRSSVMAHLVECHFMVPTDIMGQNDSSPRIWR